MSKEIIAEIEYVVDADGTEVILRAERCIAAEERKLSVREQENIALLHGITAEDKAIGRARARLFSDRRLSLASERARREELLPHAQKQRILLRRPKWLRFSEAESAAQPYDPSGMVRPLDPRIMMRELLPECLVFEGGMTREQAADMQPGTAEYLWNEYIYPACRPDPDKLDFLSL